MDAGPPSLLQSYSVSELPTEKAAHTCNGHIANTLLVHGWHQDHRLRWHHHGSWERLKHKQRKIWGSRRTISYVNLVTSSLTIIVLATAQPSPEHPRTCNPQEEWSGPGRWFHLHQHSSTPLPLGWKTWAKTRTTATET